MILGVERIMNQAKAQDGNMEEHHTFHLPLEQLLTENTKIKSEDYHVHSLQLVGDSAPKFHQHLTYDFSDLLAKKS